MRLDILTTAATTQDEKNRTRLANLKGQEGFAYQVKTSKGVMILAVAYVDELVKGLPVSDGASVTFPDGSIIGKGQRFNTTGLLQSSPHGPVTTKAAPSTPDSAALTEDRIGEIVASKLAEALAAMQPPTRVRKAK